MPRSTDSFDRYLAQQAAPKPELIDKGKLLEELAKTQQECVAGEKRNPDDPEWTTMREVYDDVIRTVQNQPTAGESK